ALISTSYMLARAPSNRVAVVTALLLAGFSLIHFVVCIFGCAWCLAAWLAGSPQGQRIRALAHFAAASIIAIALTLPWIMLLVSKVLLVKSSSPMYFFGND